MKIPRSVVQPLYETLVRSNLGSCYQISEMCKNRDFCIQSVISSKILDFSSQISCRGPVYTLYARRFQFSSSDLTHWYISSLWVFFAVPCNFFLVLFQHSADFETSFQPRIYLLYSYQ